jgi:putative ABC transport system substrate-binding protein
MASHIGRRKFLATLGGAAASWPLAARAQQRAMPIIGFLHSATSDAVVHFATAFRNGLRETGFIEGHNLAVEYRFAQGHYDRLPTLAADLVGRQVAVIVASGGDPPALAVKAATTTIPIVFTCSTDPVKLGLVTSLNRPGGNATGVSGLTSMMLAKRLELIRELVSSDATIAALMNPSSSSAEAQSKDLLAAAQAYKQRLIVGVEVTDNFRRAATYADRILKGEKPSELPVQAPVKFELVVNLKTAKALGLDVPPLLQQRADEVIE